MAIARLPVAGVDVRLDLPTGAEDLLLLEAGDPDFGTALELLRRVAQRVDGEPIEWSTITVTDVDVLLLRLRQRVLGDVVRADVACPATHCRAPVDIGFSIDKYIEHHRPRRADGVSPADEPGWFRLDDVEFRLPRAVDQLVIAAEARAEDALRLRCIRPGSVSAAVRRRVEKSMEAMAPNLCSELRGTCPHCGTAVTALFDPMQFTLRELRDQAAFLYEDVSAIAHHMHWSEAEILAMPARRRARYVELAQHEGATA